jgi:hypothetical protein
VRNWNLFRSRIDDFGPAYFGKYQILDLLFELSNRSRTGIGRMRLDYIRQSPSRGLRCFEPLTGTERVND